MPSVDPALVCMGFSCIHSYMHAYIHTDSYILVNSHMHMHLHMNLHSHIYIYVYMYMYMYMYTYMYMYMYMFMYVIYICISIHMYIYISAYTYTYIHTCIHHKGSIEPQRPLVQHLKALNRKTLRSKTQDRGKGRAQGRCRESGQTFPTRTGFGLAWRSAGFRS